VIQNTTQTSLDPLTLIVALDESGRGEGTPYEDEGDGFGYESGMYLLTTYDARTIGNFVRVSIKGQQGFMPRPRRDARVELITDSAHYCDDDDTYYNNIDAA